jgi:ABC-type Fe3+-hydroxamate transport system substrate-binding protein
MVFTFLAGGAFLYYAMSRKPDSEKTTPQALPGDYKRIITLAPNITESIFALGLGERVIGVTRHCSYPPRASALPKIGGYDDPSCETILRLKPDLVVGLPRHQRVLQLLSASGTPVLRIKEGGLASISSNLETLSSVCQAGRRGQELIADLKTRTDKIRSLTDGRPRQRVLVSVGRNMGSAGLKEVYAAGRDRFYDSMLEIAGGQNCLAETKLTFSKLSTESIMRLNPDVILDMVDDPYRNGGTPEKIIKDWSILKSVNAVRNKQVFVLGGGHVVVPGPRYIMILEEMAGILHPELFKEKP